MIENYKLQTLMLIVKLFSIGMYPKFLLNLTPENVSVILYEVGVATKDFVTLQGLTKLPTMEIFATRFAITYNTLPWATFQMCIMSSSISH